MFYKAAWYDRNARLTLSRRYHIRSEKRGYVITCGDQPIHRIPLKTGRDSEYKQAAEWLNQNFSEWENPLAYWENLREDEQK